MVSVPWSQSIERVLAPSRESTTALKLGRDDDRPRRLRSARSTSSALGGCTRRHLRPCRAVLAQPPAQPRPWPGPQLSTVQRPRATRRGRRGPVRRATFVRRTTTLGLSSEDRHDVALGDVVEQLDQLVTHPVAAKGQVVVGLVVTRDNASVDDELVQRTDGPRADGFVGSFTIGESPSKPAPRSMLNSTVSARSSIV